MSPMRYGFAAAISQLHDRLRCGLRAERADIRAFLPWAETKRAGFRIPRYAGILVTLSTAYVVVLSVGALE
jgi:hypothetical protein